MSGLEPLARDVEALLFLSPNPIATADLAKACEVDEAEVVSVLGSLQQGYTEGGRGIVLREVAGGWALSSNPESEDPARRLFASPRTPPLTAAQAETLAIVAYLQPVSRPEIARIRGVNAESAVATLLERGLVEEAGRSPFGAVLYRTGDLFLRLFGLGSIEDLPDIGAWDPAPEVEQALRERLLEVGALRSGEATSEGEGQQSLEVEAEASGSAGPAGAVEAGEQSDPANDLTEPDTRTAESDSIRGFAGAEKVPVGDLDSLVGQPDPEAD
ncbi:MAG: SMC-Scp complex subunit ScpB [Actinomycetes bacterium]